MSAFDQRGQTVGNQVVSGRGNDVDYFYARYEAKCAELAAVEAEVAALRGVAEAAKEWRAADVAYDEIISTPGIPMIESCVAAYDRARDRLVAAVDALATPTPTDRDQGAT